MASFTVHLGTQPLAESVDRLTDSVSIVDQSLNEMTSQLVEAEQKAAEHVSNNVTYGFYMLTRNQFMQKSIALQNEVNTIFLKIQSFMKALGDIKNRMEKDYNNISSQYLKIFKNIDASLNKRIADLDQGLVDLTVTGREKMTERRLDGAMKAVAYPTDLLSGSQRIMLSRMKVEAEALLADMVSYIEAGRELSKKLAASLSAHVVADEGETVYFPVVIVETESMAAKDTYATEIKMPAFPDSMSGVREGDVTSKTVQFKGDADMWKNCSKTSRDLILDELRQLCSGLDERKAKQILALAEASQWKELRN